jgi:hypothetical protein
LLEELAIIVQLDEKSALPCHLAHAITVAGS